MLHFVANVKLPNVGIKKKDRNIFIQFSVFAQISQESMISSLSSWVFKNNEKACACWKAEIFDAKACEKSQLESSRPIDASPVEDVEGEEENGEDDEEGEVGHGVVVLLPLGPVQLPQLHLEQDRSVPGQTGQVVQTGDANKIFYIFLILLLCSIFIHMQVMITV